MEFKEYDFEIERIKKKIKDSNAKSVLIELPDGVKPLASRIADELKPAGAEIFIWADTCFGACDIPKVKVDLVVQFGHSAFRQ